MASSKSQTPPTDSKAELPVLIIGAGLAGLTVALHMAETQPVIVMAKRGLGEAATAWAQGGIVGVVDKVHDSVDSHVADTLDAGAGLVVESTARYIAEESAEAIRWLVEQGVPFTADETGPMGLHLTREGGHSQRRIAHVADATGKAIHEVLLDKARAHKNIQLLEHWIALDLITNRHLDAKTQRTKPNRCYGVYALDINNNRVETIEAKSVVLATGGVGKVYKYTRSEAFTPCAKLLPLPAFLAFNSSFGVLIDRFGVRCLGVYGLGFRI
jgi:L-aspartate oxidase